MISLTKAVLMRGTTVLLDEADLIIHTGQKTGVVGRNGSGKTSLFACFTGQLPLDAGTVSVPQGLRISQMLQETAGSDRSAREYVIDGDREYRRLERKLREAEANGDENALTMLHDAIDERGAYDIENRAEQLLSGLGFTTAECDRPVEAFSGGWRVRLNLAAALMCPSDLLLLDEPTNHLDMEATLWLEQWLGRYEGTLLIVSHDRGFLDKVIDSVISLENYKTIQYRGNYSAYEKQRAERMAQQQAFFEKQQRRKSEIEDFVRRFRAKASKAKQAQSRLKELNRMQEMEPAHADSPFSFHLPAADNIPDNLLTLDHTDIGYSDPILNKLRLVLRASDRIGLLGLNGSGKTTLLKSLAGQLAPLAGELLPARHLKTGYFAQHQVDVLRSDCSAMQIMQSSFPGVREQVLRDYLGGFDFRGTKADSLVGLFSGGEKARLALALVAFSRPNLLLLDEPTNHLDLEMRHALTVALQEFGGAIVLVSHDRHLLMNTVDRFLLVENGNCTEFDGTLAAYEKRVRKASAGSGNGAQAARKTQGVNDVKGSSGTKSGANHIAAQRSDVRAVSPPEPEVLLDKKQRRQLAAARRERVAPMRTRLKFLEKEIEKLQHRLSGIDRRLADQELYDEARKPELTALLQDQGQLQAELTASEEEWLALGAELESGNTR
ncbi:MAG: ATP-binding cassette domain-containing protein [Pseudohongiellaceae bacterium]